MDATPNVNLVDAITDRSQQIARARTTITRLGFVKTAPSGGLVTVTMDGQDYPCAYDAELSLIPGAQVYVLVTADLWIVAGVIGNATYTGKPLVAIGTSSAGITAPSVNAKVNLGTYTGDAGAGSVSSGNLVLAYPGTYWVMYTSQWTTKEAATELCTVYTYIRTTAGTLYWNTARGNGTNTTFTVGMMQGTFAAGAPLWLEVYGLGMGASPTLNYWQIQAMRIGPQ